MDAYYNRSNYLRVVLAGLIDAAIIISVLFIPIMNTNPENTITKYPITFIFLFLLFYRNVTIVGYNSTLGMKIMGIIYLTLEEEVLSIKEKFLAAFFILFEGVNYYKKA